MSSVGRIEAVPTGGPRKCVESVEGHLGAYFAEERVTPDEGWSYPKGRLGDC